MSASLHRIGNRRMVVPAWDGIGIEKPQTRNASARVLSRSPTSGKSILVLPHLRLKYQGMDEKGRGEPQLRFTR